MMSLRISPRVSSHISSTRFGVAVPGVAPVACSSRYVWSMAWPVPSSVLAAESADPVPV